MKFFALVAAAAFSLVAAPGWAQGDEGAARMREKLRQGDRVTLKLDTGTIKGRLASVGPDALVVRTSAGEESVAFASVREAGRTRRSFLLGMLVGAGAGAAGGAALASLVESEGGSAAGAVAGMMLMGAGIGAGIDALLNLEHTVYRREAAARVSVQPILAAHGGAAHVLVRW